jgi:hypothetical protein
VTFFVTGDLLSVQRINRAVVPRAGIVHKDFELLSATCSAYFVHDRVQTGFESTTWSVQLAPKGTPKEIIKILNVRKQKVARPKSVRPSC